MAEVETLKKELIRFLPVNGKNRKPFVITRNINSEKELKVGDIVYDIQTKWHGKLIKLMQEFSQVKFIELDYKERNIYTNRLQKVLGEVSPKATFVEDGKEYEVIIGWDGWHKQYWKENYKIGEDNFEPVVVQIKCPTCKNYH